MPPFHALQVVTVKVLPPSVSRIYLGEVGKKITVSGLSTADVTVYFK